MSFVHEGHDPCEHDYCGQARILVAMYVQRAGVMFTTLSSLLHCAERARITVIDHRIIFFEIWGGRWSLEHKIFREWIVSNRFLFLNFL